MAPASPLGIFISAPSLELDGLPGGMGTQRCQGIWGLLSLSPLPWPEGTEAFQDRGCFLSLFP